MEENEKKGKGYINKQTIIAAVIGFLIGVVVLILIGWGLDYFATSAGLAKLKHGDDTVATVDGESISTEDIYNKANKIYGLNLMMSEIDKIILKDMYELTEKEEEEIKEEAQYYIDYYTAMGYTEQEFYEGNGFANYEEFLDDIRANKKTTKYIYDYLETKLEEGAVQKYYDENKASLETYDSEHILVKTSDTVTEEQALALANEIIGKLNEGKTFDELVTEYGDRIVHEELGYQGKASGLEQAYVDELVALEDGTYSKTPVKTSYGYHVVHKIATSTFEDLRGTIIETLSADLLAEDNMITYKAFVELREEKNLVIYDEFLKEKYQEYKDQMYETEETEETETTAENEVTE